MSGAIDTAEATVTGGRAEGHGLTSNATRGNFAVTLTANGQPVG